MESVWENHKLTIIAVVALVVALLSSVIVVPETQQAVVVRTGEPVRTYNRFQPNVPYGQTNTGLRLRIPFLERVQMIDKRVLDLDMERQEVLSSDQQRLQVDAYVRFRIINPRRMVENAGTEENVGLQLQPILAFRDAQPATGTLNAPVTAPTTAVQPQGHDFATLVDRLVDARDAAMPQAVKAAIQHADFGQVSLNFQTDDNRLTVSMSSADPGFAPAVQAAAAMQANTSTDSGTNSQRQDQRQDNAGQQQQPVEPIRTGIIKPDDENEFGNGADRRGVEIEQQAKRPVTGQLAERAGKPDDDTDEIGTGGNGKCRRRTLQKGAAPSRRIG